MFKVFRHAINRNPRQALAEPLKTHSSPNQFYRPFQMNIYIRDDISYLLNQEKDLQYFWKKTLIDSEAHGIIVMTLPDLTVVGLDRFSEIFSSAFSYYKKNGPVDTTNEIEVNTLITAIKTKINLFQPQNPITRYEIKSLLKFINLESPNADKFTKTALFRYLKAICTRN